MSSIEKLDKANEVSNDDYVSILAKEQILAVAYCTRDLEIRFKAGSLINQLFGETENIGSKFQQLYEDGCFTYDELLCKAYDIDSKIAREYRSIFREYFTFKSVEDILYVYSQSLKEDWYSSQLADALCPILPPDVVVVYSDKLFIKAGELKIELRVKKLGD